MEAMVKKLQQKYRKVKDDMRRWDELQARLLTQFSNAIAIINRLQVISDEKNYGALRLVPGAKEVILGKQLETLDRIHFSMRETLNDFHGVVMSINKIAKDATQLLGGGSTPTTQQMQLQVGVKPSLAECLDGLKSINEMHQSEYHVKEKVILELTWNCRENDTAALRQLLADQPNIPPDEVQRIFDIIFAEEII